MNKTCLTGSQSLEDELEGQWAIFNQPTCCGGLDLNPQQEERSSARAQHGKGDGRQPRTAGGWEWMVGRGMQGAGVGQTPGCEELS